MAWYFDGYLQNAGGRFSKDAQTFEKRTLRSKINGYFFSEHARARGHAAEK